MITSDLFIVCVILKHLLLLSVKAGLEHGYLVQAKGEKILVDKISLDRYLGGNSDFCLTHRSNVVVDLSDFVPLLLCASWQ